MNEAFSIILTVYNQGAELEAKLPAFLTQEYEPGYEVIIVDESSTDNTSNVLKLLENDYKHLYTTFLPKPSAQICHRKLALNIGIKASKYEYIIISKISTPPTDTDVLKAMAEVIDTKAELTLGYVSKKHIRLQPFDTIAEAEGHILRLERRITKVRERQYGNYAWGRYDFMILRKDCSLELLKLFEQKLSALSLIGIRLGILWKNFCRRSSTTLLYTSPTDS
ncbi:MAG: glycosyltransferase [Prevotella sp.]|nr:glycosyltransferase [Prevotella sp.]